MSKRLKFFLGHLLISIIIALAVLALVFFVWYPSPLAKAAGVTHIFLMLLVIDVILGPLLGLLVYKESKKTLKMDLTVIILIQIAALSYGLYSIAQARPVWIAYTVDRFELIKKNEVFEYNITKALPQYQHVSWFKPQFVGVQFAKDSETRNDDMFAELAGVSIAQKPERYVDFKLVKPQMQQHAKPLDELKKYNAPQLVQKTLAKYPQATAFVPLKANVIDMTVLINKEKGEVVKIVDLRPWN